MLTMNYIIWGHRKLIERIHELESASAHVEALATFAEDYAYDVYGDNEDEYPGSTESVQSILRHAARARKIINNSN